MEKKETVYKTTQEELEEKLDFIELELEKIRQLMKWPRRVRIPQTEVEKETNPL